jgi:N-acetylglutamate synthase-like GNAT family acetyltransferase
MIEYRPASADDQQAISDFVRSEHLNPTGLHWQRFTIALDNEGRLVGCVQVRHHRDGSRELGSFAVRPQWRKRGIGARLVERALLRDPGPVHLVTRRELAGYFSRWGFAPVTRGAPMVLRLQRSIGCVMGGLVSLLKGRKPNRLVILGLRP